MKTIIRITALVAIILTCAPYASAEENRAPQIAYSTKFRNVDFLFTDKVERAAREDGATYDIAIREVGWELISAVGKASNSVEGLQAILIDRINFKDRHSFVVLGVIVGNKFMSLNFNGPAPNEPLKKFQEALENARVMIIRKAESSGVELALAAQ